MRRRPVVTLGLLFVLIFGMSIAVPPIPAHAAPADGTFADLGGAVDGITRFDGGFFTDGGGNLRSWSVNFGPSAQFSVSTVLDSPNTTVFSQSLPGSHGSQSSVLASDGSIYFGTYPNGHLYRYVPGAAGVTDLGQPVAGTSYVYGLSASTDGRVSLGTYPGAHVLTYSPSAGYTDLGQVATGSGNQYVRATGFDTAHNRVYAGVGMTSFGIYSVNVATTSKTFLASTSDVPTDVTVMENRALVTAAGKLVLVDTDTNAVIQAKDTAGNPVSGFSAVSRGFSRPRNYLSYFSTDVPAGDATERHLATYDFRTDTVAVTPTLLPTALGYGWATVGPDLTLFMIANNYGPDFTRYVPATGVAATGTLAVPEQSQLVYNVLASGKDRLLATAFLNGRSAQLDTVSGAISPLPAFGQVESWITDGTKVYAGVYPDATLSVYDTATPASAPVDLADLHDQPVDGGNRPLALAKIGDILYAGTAPYYGQQGGAIASIDVTATAPITPVVTRNVVDKHTIAALAALPNGNLLAGSSTQAGDGAPAGPGLATLVEWNPATRTVVRSMIPHGSAASLNALLVEGGTAYALAGPKLFEINLATWTITRSVAMPGMGTCGSAIDGEILRHPYSDLLYVECGSRLFEVSNSFVATQLPIGRDLSRLAIGMDGDLYFAVDTGLPGWESDIGRWHPNPAAAATCTGLSQLYGVSTAADGDHLTYTTINARTNRANGGALSTAAPLPFTVKTLAAYNINTLFATSTAGALYQINVQGVSGALTLASVNQLAASGWVNMDKLTSDGSYLYGTAISGNLYRYPVSLAKPASTVSTGTLVGGGFTLQTLAAEGPGRLVATTSAGELVGYAISAAGGWTRSSLKPATWNFESLSAVNGILYGQKAGELWGYRDVDVTNGSGADIYRLGPVGVRGWTQKLLSAVQSTAPSC